MVLSEEKIRELAKQFAGEQKGIIVSIPEAAGFFGDVEAMQFVREAKNRLPEENSPMRVREGSRSGIMAFVYADSERILNNPAYLDKFVQMATECGNVSDIVISTVS